MAIQQLLLLCFWQYVFELSIYALHACICMCTWAEAISDQFAVDFRFQINSFIANKLLKKNICWQSVAAFYRRDALPCQITDDVNTLQLTQYTDH